MYRDQFGEFVWGYWGLKGKEARKFFMRRCNFVLFHTKKYTLPKQTLFNILRTKGIKNVSAQNNYDEKRIPL